jgi:hypothetical protein
MDGGRMTRAVANVGEEHTPAAFADAMARARATGAARAATAQADDHSDRVVLADLFAPDAMVFVAADGPRPDGIDDVVDAATAQLQALQDQANSAIGQAEQAAGSNKQAFIDQMEAAKTAAKQQMGATIDDAYNKVTQIGQAHPEAQNRMLQAMTEISVLGGAADSAMSTAFDSAIGVAWEALQVIEAAAEDAVDAISSAADTVAEGIASVFSGW